MESVRKRCLRRLHFSIRTEDAYDPWVKRFVLFHGKRHLLLMGEAGDRRLPGSLLAVQGVAASTQNQALAALLFLYNVVLEQPQPPDEDGTGPTPERVPVIPSRDKVPPCSNSSKARPASWARCSSARACKGNALVSGPTPHRQPRKRRPSLQPRATPRGS
ncbi:MAG: site-specific integrase [Isosphaeraceae bacterium]